MKILGILKTGCGWFITAFSAIYNFIWPERSTFIAVFVLVLFDLFWAMVYVINQKKFVLSELIRQVFSKLFVYIGCLFVIYLVEMNFGHNWMIATKTIGTIMSACELWSASAYMLILFPNIPFLRLFRLQLKGEIEKKIGTNLDEILPDEKPIN